MRVSPLSSFLRTRPPIVAWAQVRHLKPLWRLPQEDSHVKTRWTQNESGHKGIQPQQDNFCARVRHIVVEAKQRALSPGHRLPSRIVRQIPQPSSLSLSLLSLLVQIDLQEPKCCLKAMAPDSSTLAWKIPWTEEPGGLQSMGS